MNTTDMLPHHLDDIARQLGEKAHRLYGLDPSLARNASIELGETFSLWTARPGFLEAERTPAKLFENVGYWHQILIDGNPAAYARSLADPGSANAPSVEAIGISPAVAKIDAAIGWIEQHVHKEHELRLLLIPAAYTLAFWLADKQNQILPVDVPDPRLGALVGPHQLYRLDEFMDSVADFLKNLPRPPGAKSGP
ncbi:hypothetical protein WME76_48165 (plasmid) [Sorangium sp. So ce119]|uniref:hypothetical protein n=1 Tax=Sorangium sp. So ce119 TaxID=3133279 RepID=UPI003F5D90F7